MRERKYSSEEVQEQMQKIITSLKENPEEWRKLPYRYICLFCGVPLRSAQPILIQIRAHPNIEYRYQQTSVKIPTAICHYIEAENNTISGERFAQFDSETYQYLYNKIGAEYDSVACHRQFMLLMIFIEQLLLNGFRDNWQDLAYGLYAIMMGTEIEDIKNMVENLEKLKIIKKLGISRMYRIALSEEEYKNLEDSAYVHQQEDILNRSKKIVKDKIPEKQEKTFTVLTELNAVASAMNEMLERCYEINENIIRQQLALNTTAEALKVLQEKETVYAGMAVRINTISKNYEDAIRKSKEFEQKNNELNHLAAQHQKFYEEQKKITKENLEAMLGMVISEMEEYFSLPLREKNKMSNTNRAKANTTRIIMDAIQAIEKGKAPQ
jgi:hypothetical protein